jgi:hypothetical protein
VLNIVNQKHTKREKIYLCRFNHNPSELLINNSIIYNGIDILDSDQISILTIRCKSCGKAFPSSLKYEQSSFLDANVVDQAELCPHCRTQSSFNWEDYFFDDSPNFELVCICEL